MLTVPSAASSAMVTFQWLVLACAPLCVVYAKKSHVVFTVPVAFTQKVTNWLWPLERLLIAVGLAEAFV